MSDFVRRMVGAAKLQPGIYEEVEADERALWQATAVVVLSAIAAGIGYSAGGPGVFALTLLAALVDWVIWAALTWFIGTKLLPEKQTSADINEMLRTIGFAASPGVLRIFGIIPGIGWVIFFIAHLWMLVAVVVGVRQALDYSSTARAVAVCLIGFIVQLVVMGLIYNVLGPGAEPIVAHASAT